MKSLSLNLLDGAQQRVVKDIISLSATDNSGQFGIYPGHEFFVTALLPGMVRYQLGDGTQRFIATAGGMLMCQDNIISIVSARFIEEASEAELIPQLEHLLQTEITTRSDEHLSRVDRERALMKKLNEWSSSAP